MKAQTLIDIACSSILNYDPLIIKPKDVSVEKCVGSTRMYYITASFNELTNYSSDDHVSFINHLMEHLDTDFVANNITKEDINIFSVASDVNSASIKIKLFVIGD